MKNIVYLIMLLGLIVSCGVSKDNMPYVDYDTEQVFIENYPDDALPGKCYAKSENYKGEERWTEIICEDEYYGSLVGEVQDNLKKFGYHIDSKEMKRRIFGETTRDALNEFQKWQDYNHGVFDYGTVGWLRMVAR